MKSKLDTFRTGGAMATGLSIAEHAYRNLKSFWQLNVHAAARLHSPLPIQGDYIVGTSNGLMRMTPEGLTRLLRGHYFGVSVSEDRKLYVAWFGMLRRRASAIFEIDLDRILSGRGLYRPRCVFLRYDDIDNDRIHQLCVAGDYLYAADTRCNSIIKLDRATGEVVKTMYVFFDEHDKPICFRHNHINSVSAYGDNLLFTAFHGRGGSMLGLIGNNEVRYWAYENAGVHDIYLRGDKVLISDSFGNRKPGTVAEGTVGAVIENGKNMSEECFRGLESYMIRGIAGTGPETIVGLSVLWRDPNRKYTDKVGGLLVCNGGGHEVVAPLPFAQFFDVVRTDGKQFDEPPGSVECDDICALMTNSFGPPCKVRPLEACCADH